MVITAVASTGFIVLEEEKDGLKLWQPQVLILERNYSLSIIHYSFLTPGKRLCEEHRVDSRHFSLQDEVPLHPHTITIIIMIISMIMIVIMITIIIITMIITILIMK